MARPEKNTVDYFPKWNPNWKLLEILNDSKDRKIAFKKFRNSSSSFIKKIEVRSYILNKYNHKCNECNSIFNLEIDHIISVLQCFKTYCFEYCNTEKNLQVLCKKCNSKKQPIQ